MQTKLSSALEAIINTGSFFAISTLFQYYVVFPYLNVDVSFTENLGVTSIFTVMAIAWTYGWRRIFERYKK